MTLARGFLNKIQESNLSKNQINIITKVDGWAYDNNSIVSKKFNDIYKYAKGNEEGWDGIAKQDSSAAFKAWSLALDYIDNI